MARSTIIFKKQAVPDKYLICDSNHEFKVQEICEDLVRSHAVQLPDNAFALTVTVDISYTVIKPCYTDSEKLENLNDMNESIKKREIKEKTLYAPDAPKDKCGTEDSKVVPMCDVVDEAADNT